MEKAILKDIEANTNFTERMDFRDSPIIKKQVVELSTASGARLSVVLRLLIRKGLEFYNKKK